MKFQGAAIASLVSMSLTGLVTSAALAQELPTGSYELRGVAGELQEATRSVSNKKSAGNYIVRLKGDSGVKHQRSLTNANSAAVTSLQKAGNTYNAKTPEMQRYIAQMKQEQNQVLSDLGGVTLLHNYYHTFNGFAATLTAKQLVAVKAHPDVLGVWEDEKLELTTANTPEFLGLTGPNGQHTLGVKGEGVVVGVVDSGISPDNPSFADDGTFATPEGWAGECNVGTIGADGDANRPVDEAFTCNNKLIGAKYFGAGFASVYDIQFDLGEFNSPRDADGHGTHTASTAAGNEVSNATLRDVDIGSLSGIAPRANVAAYKVCWNSNYVNPNGVDERGCFGSDSQAAIDAAVADGVDVINYSISGSRTSNVAPQTLAMMRAAEAGVFVSVSAGNSGPGAGVVGTPAPWVMSVGASTYDGDRAIVADALDLTIDSEPQAALRFIASTFTPSWEIGFAGTLQLISSVTGCDPVDDDLGGKIALISRGACSFQKKVFNAETAGAIGVVVYNNAPGGPIAMGGTPADGAVTIPAVMVGQEDGNMLAAAAVELEAVVSFSGAMVSYTVAEVGNVMADFSSRGQNEAVADIIKPDITAPGVNILAGTTPVPLAFGNPLVGENYAYLSGTSMSAPHISGMAALLTEQFPGWTSMQKKSALMTTAYQGVTNANGSAAGPFDFGAGHADVLAARNPGFTYNADIFDWGAYLCGRGQDAVVSAETGFSCAAFANAGFDFDATQLNYASIAIGNLVSSEVVVRSATDTTGVETTYDVSIDAPQGVIAAFLVVDENDNVVESETFTVPAYGARTYGIRFEKTNDAVLEQWAFGSVTFTSGDIVNRSPIAIRPFASLNIIAPERVTLNLDRRGNASFPVEYNYSGNTSLVTKGLAAPFGSPGTVAQDADQSFDFNEPGLGFHAIEVPEGSTLARFSLLEDFVSVPNTDIDLFVYHCVAFSCSSVGSSLNFGSNETVEIVNPDPASGGDGNFYIVFTHGYDTAGADSVDYTLVYWVADKQERGTRILAPRRAVEGKFNDVRVSGRNLPFFSYMGTAEFFDGEGFSQGTTVIEALPFVDQGPQ